MLLLLEIVIAFIILLFTKLCRFSFSFRPFSDYLHVALIARVFITSIVFSLACCRLVILGLVRDILG